MILYTLVLQFDQKILWHLSEEKNRKKNCATIMISVDGKGTVFPMKLKLQGDSAENIIIKKRIFKKV